ncbi:hypothetical protein F0562_021919 [Nyssa sinensis]|uniref:Uncharacterized protein n=1 Tax=Nyssa sinensis TaxID=561372 RepID=A0A5J5BMJ1_9ASTE|nr:hypothetical protein F0562_021919 [Nyssa sinensis]
MRRLVGEIFSLGLRLSLKVEVLKLMVLGDNQYTVSNQFLALNFVKHQEKYVVDETEKKNVKCDGHLPFCCRASDCNCSILINQINR